MGTGLRLNLPGRKLPPEPGFPQSPGKGSGRGRQRAGRAWEGRRSAPREPRSNAGALAWKRASGLCGSRGAGLNVSCGLASAGAPFWLGSRPGFTAVTLERGAPPEA
jgi:hypothetical protein